MMRVPLSQVAAKHAAKAAARAHACPVAVALVDELEHAEDGAAVKTVHECNTHQGFAVCVQAKELALLTMMQEPGVAPSFNGEPVAAADGSRAEGFAAVCLANGGVTLRSVLQRDSGVPKMLKWKAVCAAIEQVWTMHTYRVVHGDLNKDNLLVRFFHGDRELVTLSPSAAASAATDDDEEEEVVDDMAWHEVVATVTIIDYENKARYGASDADLLVDRREFIEDQLPLMFSRRLKTYVNIRPSDGELSRLCLQLCPVDDDVSASSATVATAAVDNAHQRTVVPMSKSPRIPPTAAALTGTGRKSLGGKSPAAMVALYDATHGDSSDDDDDDTETSAPDDEEEEHDVVASAVRPTRRTKATAKSPAFRKAVAASKKATAGRNRATSISDKSISSKTGSGKSIGAAKKTIGNKKKTSTRSSNKKKSTAVKSVSFGRVSQRIIKKTYEHERTTEIIVNKVVSARETRSRGSSSSSSSGVSKPVRHQSAVSRRTSRRSSSSSSSSSGASVSSMATTTIVAKAAAAWARGATHSCDACSMLLSRGCVEVHERTDMIYQLTPKQKPNHTTSMIFCGMCYQSYTNGGIAQKTKATTRKLDKATTRKSAEARAAPKSSTEGGSDDDTVEMLDMDGHLFEELPDDEIDDQQMADGHTSDDDEEDDEDDDDSSGESDASDLSPCIPERGLDRDTLHSMGLDSSSEDEDN